MKYLKIFEEFNNEFPDVFNGTLKRRIALDILKKWALTQ
jgi:hypothetical protein